MRKQRLQRAESRELPHFGPHGMARPRGDGTAIMLIGCQGHVLKVSHLLPPSQALGQLLLSVRVPVFALTFVGH